MYVIQVCEECPNIRFEEELNDIDVKIHAGMFHGDTITYPGEGEVEVDGLDGNLVIGVHALPHQRFERIGNDLHTNITITLEVSHFLIEFHMF